MNSKEKIVFQITKTSPLIKRVTWNKSKDAQLRFLVDQNEGKSWKYVSEKMKALFHDSNLTMKKCRERWQNCLNPRFNKTIMINSELLLLLAYHQQYGNKWSEICKYFPDRNSLKLKNDFTNHVLKTARRINHLNIDDVNNIFQYISITYSIVLIYQLILSNNSSIKISKLGSTHIYENILKLHLTPELCMTYLEHCTNSLISKYNDHPILKNLLELNQIISINSLLTKVFEVIKSYYSTQENYSESFLISTMESLIIEESPLISYESKADTLSKMSIIPYSSFENMKSIVLLDIENNHPNELIEPDYNEIFPYTELQAKDFEASYETNEKLSLPCIELDEIESSIITPEPLLCFHIENDLKYDKPVLDLPEHI